MECSKLASFSVSCGLHKLRANSTLTTITCLWISKNLKTTNCTRAYNGKNILKTIIFQQGLVRIRTVETDASGLATLAILTVLRTAQCSMIGIFIYVTCG